MCTKIEWKHPPAESPFTSNANDLILVGQVLTTFKVEGLNLASGGAIKVLDTAVWGQVIEITAVLSNLKCTNKKQYKHKGQTLELHQLTLISQSLVGMVLPMASVPNWNTKSLQDVSESTYTEMWTNNNEWDYKEARMSYYADCCWCHRWLAESFQ